MADQQEGDPQAIAENPFRLVVVAASAGGIAALTGGFPAAVAIVQHRPPRAPSVRPTPRPPLRMPVTDAKDGELFRPAGPIFAPADYHCWSMPMDVLVHAVGESAWHPARRRKPLRNQRRGA